MMVHPDKGFSLIELATVISLIAIIYSFAIPAWRDSILKTRRADATGTLLHIAARQEQFRLQNRRYASTEELALAPPLGLGISGTPDNHYELSLQTNTAGYTATAIVRSNGSQDDDNNCRIFSLSGLGTRVAFSATGEDTSDQCWQQ